MIRTSFERRLAVVATAALTLAIWALPASAAPRAEMSGGNLMSLARHDGSGGPGVAARRGIFTTSCYTATDSCT
jgi:hypothetical protein